MNEGILEQLSLPTVNSVADAASDGAFAELYDRFVLSLSDHGNYIKADYELFFGHENSIGGRLFACILQPDELLKKDFIDSLIFIDEFPEEDDGGNMHPYKIGYEDFVSGKFWDYTDIPEFRKDLFDCCLPADASDKDDYISAVKGFDTAAMYPEYMFFNHNRHDPEIEISFDFVWDHIAASSLTIYAFVINDDWDMICAKYHGELALPSLLGFVKRDNLANNFLSINKVVRAERLFISGGSIYEWSYGLDDSDRSYIKEVIRNEDDHLVWDYLSPLEKIVRDKLYKEAKGYQNLNKYLVQINKLIGTGKRSLFNSVFELFNVYRKPDGLEWFNEVIKDLEKARYEKDKLIEENDVSNIPIGDKLYGRLLQWKDWGRNDRYPNDVENISWTTPLGYISRALNGRGKEVIAFLREIGDKESQEVIDKIYSEANSRYSHGQMAQMHNGPLRLLKRELNILNSDEKIDNKFQ